MPDPTLQAAFLAGLISFVTPCVLPLVPGYLSYMSGFSVGEEPLRASRTTLVAVGFVIGFTAIFVPLGATASYLGSLLNTNKELLGRIGGALIIVLGLTFIGVLKIPFLYREARWHPTPGAGFWGSVVLGAAFAFGWSPCIGLTMGTALTMAAGLEPGRGALLLAIYSLGLGLPFIVAGVGISRLTKAVRWLRRHTRALNIASGLILVAVGILFVTNSMYQLSIWMQRSFESVNLDFWTAF
jgi:cytochrome c-type biogenesis protein